MLVCLVPMMTLLPAWLLRGRQNVLDVQLGDKLERETASEVDRRARLGWNGIVRERAGPNEAPQPLRAGVGERQVV